MFNYLSSILLFGLCINLQAQNADYKKQVVYYQDSINHFLKNPTSTYILKEEFDDFESMNFFAISDEYKIHALLIESPTHEVFKLTYSKDPNAPVYVVYGQVHFEVNGKKCNLNVYQKTDWLGNPELKNQLFLPFKDWTNGPQSYGGGRFLDLTIPKEGNMLTIDFNMSYNPPCAYNYNMACPLIPESNYIETEVYAGILAY